MPLERRTATLLAFVRTLEASAQDDVLDLFDIVVRHRLHFDHAAHIDTSLRELRRVLRPGGRLVSIPMQHGKKLVVLDSRPKRPAPGHGVAIDVQGEHVLVVPPLSLEPATDCEALHLFDEFVGSLERAA